MSLRWVKLPARSIREKCWGRECVVYSYASGDTHLIESGCLDVWHLLSDTPKTIAQLEHELGLERSEDGGIHQGVSEALDSLRQAGLVSSRE